MRAEVERRRAEQQMKKDNDNMQRTLKMQAEQQVVEVRQAELAKREQQSMRQKLE